MRIHQLDPSRTHRTATLPQLTRPTAMTRPSPLVQRLAVDPTRVHVHADTAGGLTSALHDGSRSRGEPLAASTRASLEASLGTDLSDVRVHTGEASARATAACDAHAITYGQDIHFAPGRYQPARREGDRLIAHEVAHTIQQRGAREDPTRAPEVGRPGDRHEVEADRFANSWARGGRTTLQADGMARVACKKIQAFAPSAAVAAPAEAPLQIAPGVADTLPRSLRYAVGTLDYYRTRNLDYEVRSDYRLAALGVRSPPAPKYYLAYGDLYAHRFRLELRPKLSDAGKAWVDRTFVLLHQAIEDRRDADPAAFAELERDAPRLLAFAYDTHPKAYLDAGLADLPPWDLARIALTPDPLDILNLDGLKQILITAGPVLGKYGYRSLQYQAEGPIIP